MLKNLYFFLLILLCFMKPVQAQFSNPLAKWSFEETSGAQIIDSGTHNLDGVIIDSVLVKKLSCGEGKSVSLLDAQMWSARMEVPDNDVLDFGANQSFTISCLVKADPDLNKGTEEYGSILVIKGTPDNGDALGGVWYGIEMKEYNGSQQLRFAVDDKAVKSVVTLHDYETKWDANEWHHVVGVRHRAEDSLKLYLDGVLVASVLDNLTATIANIYNFYIGGTFEGHGQLQGAIDEVTIFDEALSATDVSNLYSSFNLSNTCETYYTLGYHTLDSIKISAVEAVDSVFVGDTIEIAAEFFPANATFKEYKLFADPTSVAFIDTLTTHMVCVSTGMVSTTVVSLKEPDAITNTLHFKVVERPDDIISDPLTLWSFEEDEGPLVVDSGRLELSGVIVDSLFVERLSCGDGRSVSLLNAETWSARMEIPDNDALDFGSDQSFSISCLVKADPEENRGSSAYGSQFVVKGSSDNNDANGGIWYGMEVKYFNNSHQLRFAIDDKDVKSSVSLLDYDTQWDPEIWHHIVGVRHRAEDSLKLYLDGKLVGSILDEVNAGLSNVYNMYIGGTFEGHGRLHGAIDEVSVYDTALSAYDVNELYKSFSLSANCEAFYTIGYHALDSIHISTVIAVDSMFVGDTIKIATEFFPTNATDKSYNVVVDPTAVASINAAKNELIALAPGIVTLSVTTPNQSGVASNRLVIKVVDKPVIDNSNPIAKWSFEENYGSIIKDSGAHMLDGVILDSSLVERLNCGQGQSISLQNAEFWTARMEMPDNDAIDFDSAESFSISCLVKADPELNKGTEEYGSTIIVKGSPDNGDDNGGIWYGMELKYYNGSHQLRFAIDDKEVKSVVTLFDYNNQWDANKWHHVVGVRDRTEDSVKLYLDGVLVASVLDELSSTLANVFNLYLGGTFEGNGQLVGAIDEVEIYGKALSSIEVDELYQSFELSSDCQAFYTLGGSPLDSIKISVKNAADSVYVGDSLEIVTKYFPSNASNKIHELVAVPSSVATYNFNSGQLVGVASGVVTMSVTIPDQPNATSNSLEIKVVEKPTSIYTKAMFGKGLCVYPIPASNEINIQVNSEMLGEVIRITDLSGRTIHTTMVSNRLTSINVSAIKTGVYIVKLKDRSVKVVIN